MKFLTIKSLVTISNIALYLIFILVFLAFGGNVIPKAQDSIIKTSYFLIIFSVCLFLLYHFLRRKELKKTDFQLTYRHITWMYIFYIGQYVMQLMALIYIILIKTAAVSTLGGSIYFYVMFPISFILTTFTSVLESIIRAEERIFAYKKVWAASQQWNEEHHTNEDNPFANENDGEDSAPTQEIIVKNTNQKKDNPFE